METKKRTIIISVIIIALIIITIGATYAFFTANINGNESTSTLLATGGTLEIWYENQSGTIELYNIYPREEAWVSKTFTLTGKNTTDMQMKYSIGLKVDSNTFTSESLSYSLISENTSNNGEIVSPKQNISITKDLHYFGTGHFLTGENLVHTYTLEIYYKDNGQNQNANQGASFTGHIIIIDGDIPPTQIALSTSNLSLIGYTDNVVPTSLTIPESYKTASGETYQVTSIANEAFLTERDLSGHLTMSSTVKTIGSRAFAGSGITGLMLNEGLESIGFAAFAGTTNLTGTLIIPSTVKTIGEQAFYQTGITGLTLNEGLESIGIEAFGTGLNEDDTAERTLTGHLTIPSTVKTIGDSAFDGTGITSLTLNEGLESIGKSAFADTIYLTGTIEIPSTIKDIPSLTFGDSKITGLILNEGLETIGRGAFKATDIEGNLTIPNTVKTIGDSAFLKTKITSLTLPLGLESIGAYAFQYVPITVINYRGSEEEWNQIAKTSLMYDLPSGVTINYNYTGA